ncbi:hypothetical protein HFP89_08300 [Wenzhouxiangella sp. XN79A]|uniref:hypothetical protein n=1 Tax=Wenzhouxiangella sp. XN79A TaxID=2724193 RepID=UPI00144AB9BE|nr:hypothetical protein [Wenzhouxiangella sp. XN79A]NKI35165.1 hypothetical protein [Wenzhouxiangella sp. XN79A]
MQVEFQLGHGTRAVEGWVESVSPNAAPVQRAAPDVNPGRPGQRTAPGTLRPFRPFEIIAEIH